MVFIQRRMRPISRNAVRCCIFALVSLLIGCTSKGATETSTSKRDTGGATTDGPHRPDGFAKARAAFMHRAAAVFHTGDDTIRIMPNSEGETDLWTRYAPGINPSIGKAWAFDARGPGPATGGSLRGWATSSGVVIAHGMDYGPLLEEAGLWKGDPQRAIKLLIPRLRWSLRADHPTEGRVPTMNLAADGSGQCVFMLKETMPPGGGMPLATVKPWILSVAADHSATLKQRKHLDPRERVEATVGFPVFAVEKLAVDGYSFFWIDMSEPDDNDMGYGVAVAPNGELLRGKAAFRASAPGQSAATQAALASLLLNQGGTPLAAATTDEQRKTGVRAPHNEPGSLVWWIAANRISGPGLRMLTLDLKTLALTQTDP